MVLDSDLWGVLGDLGAEVFIFLFKTFFLGVIPNTFAFAINGSTVRDFNGTKNFIVCGEKNNVEERDEGWYNVWVQIKIIC